MVEFTRLRLSGFKSFVDPTELSIDRGLTGIVGPNGCGKSNLVEALRWVMGETSAKRMRGSEMDDVIFAGSASRPSRSIAEVSLHLDNSRRLAPSQFSEDELEVTRRIEREKGSLYRVNGADVRARDVQLLFADAATGAHSTALVSQGRVGALINAKPTDRRALLEEAAGITGLHSRRHEAELRLRAAESNLERLDDVITTLEAQLQALQKQARQAVRYRRVSEQVRRNDALLLHIDAGAAETALETAKEKLEEAEALVSELSQSAAKAASEQAEAAAALPPLRQSDAAAGATVQRLLVDREQLQREEAQLEAQREQAEARVAQLDRDRQRTEEQLADAKAARERLEAERRELKAATESETAAEESALAEHDRAAAAVGESETALGEITASIASDEARAAALSRRVEELGKRLLRLTEESARAAEERRRLEAEQAEDAELAAAESDLQACEAALVTARENAEHSEVGASDARRHESTARDTLQQIETARQRLDAEITAIARLLEQPQADAWPALIDAVSADAGYEIALGAALGDDLSASTDEAAPVHWETLPPLETPPLLPAGVRPLSAVVRAPAALARRLSQIGLVEDASEARRLQDRLAVGQRLVSQRGDLWRWDGFTVKAEAPSAAAQRLEQRSRLAELREERAGLSSRVADAEQEFAEAHQASEIAQAGEREARTRLATAFHDLNEARRTQTTLAQKTAERRTRLESLKETEERLAREHDESESARSEAEAERAAMPDLAIARNRATELRAELAERRQHLGECRSQLERLRRDAETRALRLQAIDGEDASWSRRGEDAARHHEELATRRDELIHELESLSEKPAEIAKRRDALAESIASAEAARKTAADALAEGEARQSAADRALKAEEQRLAQAREERVRREGTLGQAEQQLTQIADKVRDHLNCALTEVLTVAEIDPGQELPPREEVETKLTRLMRERDNIGPVNLRAEDEAAELEQQIQGMQNERSDLVSAIARLRHGIGQLNREGRERLMVAFEQVNAHFSELFVRLFGGGRAHLALTEAEDPLEAGLEIMASPPGKRLQVMSLLSGGEQALTALALLFAVFLTNPAPICVLDEVDAPLDDANVDRFCTLVEELVERTGTRFLVITHHRMTMARMHRLYGVTMSERGISQLVSVDLDRAEELRETA